MATGGAIAVKSTNPSNTGNVFNILGSTPPVAATNDLWFDSANNTWYTYDASGAWIQLTDNAPWLASDSGLLLFNMYPESAAGSALAIAGTLYLLRINARAPITVSNVWFYVTAGGTGASSGSYVGLYSSSGTLLSGSSDIGSTLTSSGKQGGALTTPQTLTAGSFYWCAFLVNLASTQPTLARSAVASAGLPNIGLTAASYRMGVNGTGLTSLPSSVTPSSNSLTGANFYLTAVS